MSEAVAETTCEPETIAPEVGAVMETLGRVVSPLLFTLIETAALVPVCAAALLATAVSEWVPLESVAVFSERRKGALVTAAPELLPSTLNCTLMVFADTLVATLMAPETVAPEAGDVMDTVGGAVAVFLMVVETAALVAVCPAALLATAVSKWLTLESVSVFSERLKGVLVTAAPVLLPSTLNCTLVVLDETLVETVMVPETVAPESGDVIEIVGAVELLTVSITLALLVVCPVRVLATAASEWLPLESGVVFREKLNGALVTAAPVLLPSTMNCTLEVLEETLVETVMVPETAAPESGEAMEIVGGRLLTLIELEGLVVDLPGELVATAVSV